MKLDRSLVSRMLHDGISHRIVRTIIDLCNDLEINLVAEGVEDHDTAACLRDLGCEAMQGYWLSKPIPQADVIGWYENHLEHPRVIGPSDLTESTETAKRAS